MANIQALTHPEIPDQEALREFADALTDRAAEIERDMARLGREPANRVLIADLFRALHNIKGDAALCKVEVAILIAHPIESLLTRLRSGEVRHSPCSERSSCSRWTGWNWRSKRCWRASR